MMVFIHLDNLVNLSKVIWPLFDQDWSIIFSLLHLWILHCFCACIDLTVYSNVRDWSLNLFFPFQMRERQYKRRPLLNGWIPTWVGWPAGSVTSTLTFAMAACLSACWRFSLENNWLVPISLLFYVFICLSECQSFNYLFSFSAKAHQGPYAHPLSGECWQGAAIPEGAKGSPGKHGFSRHCWRKPPAYTRTHLDHNPSLPGRGLASTRDMTSWEAISMSNTHHVAEPFAMFIETVCCSNVACSLTIG